MTSLSEERLTSVVPKFPGLTCSVVAVMLLSFCCLVAPPVTEGQAINEVHGTKEKIKRNSYKTWSLFLVCNPQWLEPEKSKDLYSLYERFRSFGRAIGDDHLAVWFWKTEPKPDTPNLADDVDVERSARICGALKLKASSGPHIIIMESYPDESNLPKDFAVYELGQMTATDISNLLARLTDELVLNGRVTEDPLWVRLLASTQRLIGSFGCAWSFKIAAGFLNADLQPCRTQ